MQHLGIEMLQMQQDVVGLRPAAAPFADLDRHRARHHVARREVLGGRRIALHETLAFAVGHYPPSPRAPSVIRQPAP